MVQGSGGIANEAGVNNTDSLYFYPVATRKNDLIFLDLHAKP